MFQTVQARESSPVWVIAPLAVNRPVSAALARSRELAAAPATISASSIYGTSYRGWDPIRMASLTQATYRDYRKRACAAIIARP
jgi:hypothetical protein